MTLRAVARGGGGSPEPIEFPVESVNGKTGAVSLTAADVGAATPAQVTASTNTSKSYTDARYSAEARALLESLDPTTATVEDVITALLS